MTSTSLSNDIKGGGGRGAIRDARFWVPLSLAAIYLGAFIYARLIYAPCDDTYIYLVYIKNFLQGNGLTYNGMKVQGFTSVLWMALVALASMIPNALPTVADKLSMVTGLFVIVMTYVIGRRLGLKRWQALMPPVLLAATWDFAFYMGNGLETVLFMGMVLVTIGYLIDRPAAQALRSFSLPLVLCATILTRPEGAIVVAIVVGFLGWRSRRLAPVLRCLSLTAVLLLVGLVPLQLYYGDWLPNTYYAKAGAGMSNLGQGAMYLLNFFDAAVLPFAILIFFAVSRRGSLGNHAAPLITIIVVWIVHMTVQGGDNLVGARAFLPIMPIVYILITMGLRNVRTRTAIAIVVFIVAYHTINCNFGWVRGSSWDSAIKGQSDAWREMYEIRRDVGLKLKEMLPPESVIVVSAAGTVPYYSELPTIDALGLNNAHIARRGKRDRSLPFGHQAGDGKYILAQKPAVIIFKGGLPLGNFFLSDREIYESSDFARYYNNRRLPHNYVAYFRRGWQRPQR
jgi:hypothetical protein